MAFSCHWGLEDHTVLLTPLWVSGAEVRDPAAPSGCCRTWTWASLRPGRSSSAQRYYPTASLGLYRVVGYAKTNILEKWTERCFGNITISDYGAADFLNVRTRSNSTPATSGNVWTLSSLVQILMKTKINFPCPLGIQYWLFKWVIQERRKNIHHINLGPDSDPQASTKETLVSGNAFRQKMYVCAFSTALLNGKGAEMTNLG